MTKVEIHILNTGILEGEDERILPLIAPCYALKYEKMKVKRAKLQELGAGYLLYKVLGVTKDEELTLGEKGKPGLSLENVRGLERNSGHSGDDSNNPVFTEFSISHAEDYVILAVSTKPIGVDIERCDRLTLQVLERVLPAAYYEKVAKSTDIREWAKAWTSIEAILKAEGSGFSHDPRQREDLPDSWHIESFMIKEELMVSCACHEPIDIVRIEEN